MSASGTRSSTWSATLPCSTATSAVTWSRHRSGHQLNAALVRKLIEAIDREPHGSWPERAVPDEAAMDIGVIRKILPHRYPVPAGRPRPRARTGPSRARPQERDLQRAVLPGPLARSADHARRVDRRGTGAGRGDHDRRHHRSQDPRGPDRRHRQGQDPPARRARRPAPPRSDRRCGRSRAWPMSRAWPGSASRSPPKPRSGS